MRQRRRVFATMFLAAAATALLPTAAQAHFLGKDSVDSREIRYNDSTTYDDARVWARDKWNAVGGINIAADTASTVADLEFYDDYARDASWDGRWQERTGADLLSFNTFYFVNYSTTKRRGVAVHEVGHSLGLAHSYSGQIMVDNTPARGSLTTPQSHDKADYHTLWG